METDEKKIIALTFDDGPSETTSLKVLDKLKKYGVPGSFFVVGEQITPEKEYILKEEADYGCDIENHSFTHGDMRTMDAATLKKEIEDTTARIVKAVGKEPEFFRPPFIFVNDLMLETIPYIFICGLPCNDWEPDIDAAERAKRVLEGARNNMVVLLHDMEGNDATVEALDTIIPGLKERGFEFVTVRELFKRAGIDKSNAKKIVYTTTED